MDTCFVVIICEPGHIGRDTLLITQPGAAACVDQAYCQEPAPLGIVRGPSSMPELEKPEYLEDPGHTGQDPLYVLDLG